MNKDLPLPAEPSDVAAEELYSSWALCILTFLLIMAFLTSYFLQSRKIKAVHETVVSIFAGATVGLIIRLSSANSIREVVAFKHTLFFNLLLPPIILNSGYELKQDNFFRNLPTILTFAFAGTFISAMSLGLIVYFFSILPLTSFRLSLIECLIFGSTLSATDPVTILAIFNSYKVDPKLFTVVFGESILNDAVSIVMYETLSRFHGEETLELASFFHGLTIFLLSFSISTVLGITFGLACSLLLKHTDLWQYPQIESCLVAMVAYVSYLFSNSLKMSGIVSLLFCGITLKHYAYYNMSRRTQRTTKYMFAVLAQLSENFIFIYLGISLFTQDIAEFKMALIVVSLVAVCASRYLAVFPLSKAINFVFKSGGQRNPELPHSYQMMLFWAGLRGAVGVALAAGITGPNAAVMRTTVLIVVVVTVIVLGGTTSRMLEVMGIRMGVENDDDSSDEEDAPRNTRRSNRIRDASQSRGKAGSAATTPSTAEFEDEILPLAPLAHESAENSSGAEQRPGMIFRDGQWFTSLDERYLLPLFSNSVASRRHQAKKVIRSQREERSSSDQRALLFDQGDDAWDDANGSINARDAHTPSTAQGGGFKDSMSSFIHSYLDEPSSSASRPEFDSNQQIRSPPAGSQAALFAAWSSQPSN